MRNRLLIFCLLALSYTYAQQDPSEYIRKTVDTLCSPSFAGRGYIDQGHQKAAFFVAEEMKKAGLSFFESDFLQSYELDVNTFPSIVAMQWKGKKLTPGVDFIVGPASPSVKGSFKTLVFDSTYLSDKAKMQELKSMNLSKKIIILDKTNVSDKNQQQLMDYMAYRMLSPAAVILPVDKLTWGVSSAQSGSAMFMVLKKSLGETPPKKIKINVVAELRKKEKAYNVIGYVPGKVRPDSMIVVSAHFDHLGKMGSDVYFPGANDNASGTALMLSLARHYGKEENQPDYTMVFMGFSGEENGLLGSFHYVENPLFPLKQIRFLVNTDISGTGDIGITVVNGKIYTKEYEILKSISDEKQLFPRVKSRGKAANSDHYPFFEKGVPSFFIYTDGTNRAYHDIYDRAETLKLKFINNLESLIIHYVSQL